MILSIIIPTYNSENTIIRAINSCCIDSIEEIEVIVIDDGSQDRTIDIIRNKYREYIPSQKVKLISAYHNGAGNARNIGIREAIGEWIIFLDSDDKFKDLKAVVRDLKAYKGKSFNILNYSLNCTTLVNRSGTLFRGSDLVKDNLGLVKEELKVWDSGPVYKIFSSDFLKKNNIKFPIDIKIGEDLVFNQKCLQTNTNILVKYGDIYEVIDNKNSVTHIIVKQNILDDGIKLTRAIQNLNIPLEYKQMFIAKNFISLLVRFLKSDNSTVSIIESIKYYIKSFKLKNVFNVFFNLKDLFNPLIILVGLTIWWRPNTLRFLFPIIKKIKYKE